MRQPSGLLLALGAGLVALWVLLGIAGPLLAPFPPDLPLERFQPPGTTFVPSDRTFLARSWSEAHCPPPSSTGQPQSSCGTHWLGTNHVGHDVLSRILVTYRWQVAMVGLALMATYLVCWPLAWASRPDAAGRSGVLRAVLDQVGAVPPIILYLVLLSALGASTVTFVVSLVVASIPGVCRHVHALATVEADRRSLWLWWGGDLLSRAALFLLLLETLSFFGWIGSGGGFFSGWFPGEAPASKFPGIGAMLFDMKNMVFIMQWMPYHLIAAVALPALGANLLAAALWARLPQDLRRKAQLRLVLLPRPSSRLSQKDNRGKSAEPSTEPEQDRL